MQATVSDEEFIRMFNEMGAAELSRYLKIRERTVHQRRRRLEARLGVRMQSPNRNCISEYETRLSRAVSDGFIIVGSAAHYWPGAPSAAHRAFVALCKELKPKIVVLNGDVLDGATISRHGPIMWEDRPALVDEIDVAKERTDEIKKASPRAEHIWTLGNHDARFENKLASQADELKDVFGTRLSDHFPNWTLCWSLWINDEVVIKHRYRMGIHAAHNNVVNAGKTIVTGHTHSLRVTPFSDYNGTRFGVDTGAMADIYGPQFSYMEDNPRSWRSGFVVLSFSRGRLLWPQIAHVIGENEVEFGGRVLEI